MAKAKEQNEKLKSSERNADEKKIKCKAIKTFSMVNFSPAIFEEFEIAESMAKDLKEAGYVEFIEK